MPDNIMTPEPGTTPEPGAARCPGTSWDDIIAADSRPAPDFLKNDSYRYLGSDPIDASRYTSAEFFKAENEKMWPRVWQFAARDEELPEPGDYIVYENAGRSYLVVRQADGSVSAMHNVCLHRGRKLKTANGHAADFKCPFHGFTWNTDGSLKEIPCRWDFPHLNADNLALPKPAVGRWGGYIFVRESEEGPSLEDYLAPLPEFFERWRHEDCVTVMWVAKIVRANWKVTAEAFMEAWHSVVTHPQILPFTGDANSRYNIYGDNVNVALQPMNVLSPHLDPAGKSEQWIVDSFIRNAGRASGDGKPVVVPEGGTARRTMADSNRRAYRNATGYDFDQSTDSELVDALTYNVFPNFAPWGGFAPNIVYRWRPWHDQDTTLMEVRLLTRVPKGEKRPRSVPMKMLTEDQPWAAATELGSLGGVFDQDMLNLPYVQEGLKASKNGKVNLGDYQEIRVRHFHQTLDKYLTG
jgi:phenylpropionate dioxygenase-like ring-hydroxylating dioxygenase large terminal subunit